MALLLTLQDEILIFCTVPHVTAVLPCVLYNPMNRKGLFSSKARSEWIFAVNGKEITVQDYETPVVFQEVEASSVTDNRRIKVVRFQTGQKN